MKIFSQLLNAVPDTTGKPGVADVSKGSLQSSFASVIGAAVAATGTNGDAKLGKAQNVETKKTSGPESGKKTLASTPDIAVIVPPAVMSTVPLNVPVVLQAVTPQADGSSAKENVTSTDGPAALGASVAEVAPTIGMAVVANAPKTVLPVTLPTYADSKSGSSAPNSVQDDRGAAIKAPAFSATSDLLSKSNAAAVSATAPIVLPVSVAPATKTLERGATAETTKSDTSAGSPSTLNIPTLSNSVGGDAVVEPGKIDSSSWKVEAVSGKSGSVDAVPTVATSTGSPSEKINAAVSSAIAAVQESMPLPVATPAQATVVPPASGGPSAAVKSQSTNEAATASKANVSTGSVKQIGANVVSGPSVSGTNIAATLKSTSEAVKVPQPQSGGAISVPPALASAQPQAAAAPTDASAASASQPVEASVAALTQQNGTQQAEAIAVTVPQQTVIQSIPSVQSVDSPVGISSASTVKVTAGKSDAVGTPSQFSVASKGRTSGSDLRVNRNAASDDDKSSATETVSGALAARVAGPEVVSKETAGNFKGAMESATLTQNAQSAQVAGQSGSTPAPTAPIAVAPGAGVATNAALPAHAAPAASAQAAQALNSAQLIQSVHGSEMRLGMNSAEFGNISINTSINHQTLSAQISMEHSALGSALAMHLPAIEEKLGSAYGLQAKVELRDTGTNSTASDSSSSQSSGDRRSQGGSNGRPTTGVQSSIGALTSSNFTSSSTSMAAGTSRLDIRI